MDRRHEPKPPQLEADVWGLLTEKEPKSCAPELTGLEGDPIEITGGHLCAMYHA